MTDIYPIVLSFDVGLIHLSYCLLKKKNYDKKTDWEILDWNNIDLSGRENMKCVECGKKASMTNMIDNKINYYCKIHGKKVDVKIETFEECFRENKNNKCCYELRNKTICNKSFFKIFSIIICICYRRNLSD